MNINQKLSPAEKAKELFEVFGKNAGKVALYLVNETSYIAACYDDGVDKAFDRMLYWGEVILELPLEK